MSDRYTGIGLGVASLGVILILLVVAVALAVIICSFSVRKIMGEIHRRESAEQATHRLNEQLELKVSQRTADLESSYQNLQVQIAERQAVEEQLRQKNAFLEAQLNSTVDGLLVVDENGKKVLQNRRFGEIFQLPPHVFDDHEAQSGIDYVVGKIVDPENFLRSVRQMKEHREEIVSDEVEFLDGTVIDRYSAPAVGDDGKYYGRIWVFRDVSERKRNEAEVRRLSLAVEQSPVSVMITDPSGKMIYVNRKFVECTGYSCEEAIGKNPRLLKSGHTSAEEYRRIWETITSGKEWRGEFHNRKKNGELYWEYAVITPMRDAKGNITHFLGLKEDITERRLLQSQLQRAQKLEAIGQLAAGIAHEINTPMQFIGDNTRFLQQAWVTLDKLIGMFCTLHEATTKEAGFRDCLLGYDVDDLRDLQQEVPAAIEQSLRGVGRVSNIVRAMKEFSHPGSDDKQPTDINHTIENTVTVARNEWKYVAEVETFLSPDVGLVSCHRAEFNQVILNLLVNAAHAIAEGVGEGSKSRGKITIRTMRDPKGVEISVHDTGCGIPAAVKPHIFEPFFTTKEVGRGTGQNLALAHAIIVKQHNGNIWFESESGKGTTFFIHLPA